MRFFLGVLLIELFVSCSSSEKKLLYSINGNRMDSTTFYSIHKDGDYVIYHTNGEKAEIGQYLDNKQRGDIFYFDTLGRPIRRETCILIAEDSLGYGFWDESLDSINSGAKFSYINYMMSFFHEGDSIGLDSLNSVFINTWFESDTISLGEDVIFYTYVICPYFREKSDSIRYWYGYETSDIEDGEFIKIIDSPIGTLRYTPKKRGTIKIRYQVTEENATRSQNRDYYGCRSFYVK